MTDLDLTAAANPAVALLIVQYAQEVLSDNGIFDTDRTGEYVQEIIETVASLIAGQIAAAIEAAAAATYPRDRADHALICGAEFAARIAREAVR